MSVTGARTIGASERTLNLNLPRAGDLVFNLVARNPETGAPANWPNGIVLELVIGEQTYAAQVSGSTAAWAISAATVADLRAEARASDELEALWFYTSGGHRMLWATGEVTSRG